MSKSFCASAGTFLLAILLPMIAVSQAPKDSRTIEVQVNYTGSGPVNGTHKIVVALWDSPDFVKGSSRPVAIKATDSKNGTVTFSGVEKVPAYVSCAYAPSGAWDGESGPPPSGSSVGMYSKTPPTPAPIDVPAGKNVKVKITFDDAVKFP